MAKIMTKTMLEKPTLVTVLAWKNISSNIFLLQIKKKLKLSQNV